MTEPHERLQLARYAAGFQTATEAANHFNLNENTYRSHENGERGIRPKVAEMYAKIFEVSISWLLTGEGNPRGNKHIPIIGSVAHNGLITHISGFDYVSSIVNKLIETISSELVVPEKCIGYYVRHDIIGKFGSQDVLLSWNRQRYDKNIIADGILWVGEKEAGLQVTSRGLNGQLHTQHRFDPHSIPDGSFFDPIQAVILGGNYKWLHEEMADRWGAKQT